MGSYVDVIVLIQWATEILCTGRFFKMFGYIWIILIIAQVLEATPCEPCKSELCATPISNCPAGNTTDRCGCCQICARTENELCDQSPEEDRYGMCGENLDCVSRKEDGGDPEEFVCKCREVKMVCSNEDTTYNTICALNEESIKRGSPDKYSPQLSMLYWGPCKESPVTITWQSLSTDGKTISLPSDDQSVSIQMRGGPEPLMVTGWMQIMSLDPSYIGDYHCIASNSEGKAFSKASVGVYKNEL